MYANCLKFMGKFLRVILMGNRQQNSYLPSCVLMKQENIPEIDPDEKDDMNSLTSERFNFRDM